MKNVKTILCDVLNIPNENEYIWYIVSDKTTLESSLICDLTGAYFNTLLTHQQVSSTLADEKITYQATYTQPTVEKTLQLIKAITHLESLQPTGAVSSLSDLKRFQIVMISKIFTYESGRDYYNPLSDIIYVEEELNQLYLKFPFKWCLQDTKRAPIDILLDYLTKKLTQVEIKLLPPKSTALTTYFVKQETKQKTFAHTLVQEYLQSDPETGLQREELMYLAKTITTTYPLDQWTTQFSQQVKELEETHTTHLMVIKEPLPNQENHDSRCQSHLFKAPRPSAFTPVSQSPTNTTDKLTVIIDQV